MALKSELMKSELILCCTSKKNGAVEKFPANGSHHPIFVGVRPSDASSKVFIEMLAIAVAKCKSWNKEFEKLDTYLFKDYQPSMEGRTLQTFDSWHSKNHTTLSRDRAMEFFFEALLEKRVLSYHADTDNPTLVKEEQLKKTKATRESFETFVKTKDLPVTYWLNDPAEGYYDENVQNMWLGWQACSLCIEGKTE